MAAAGETDPQVARAASSPRPRSTSEATTAAGVVPVGVASGHYSADELKAAGGHVLGSLEEPFPGLS